MAAPVSVGTKGNTLVTGSLRVHPSIGIARVGNDPTEFLSMTIDPLASAGLQMALADGIDIAEVLSGESGSASVQLRYFGNARVNGYHRYPRELADYYALERRWPSSRYWTRRTGAARDALGRHQVAS